MWIKKKDVEQLSEFGKGYISGEELDLRDHSEGTFNILKNDIYALVSKKNEEIGVLASELLEAVMPSVAILLDINSQRVELNHDRVINLSIRKVFPVLYSVPWATLVLGTAALFATVMLITYLEMNKLKEKSLIDEIRMDVM